MTCCNDINLQGLSPFAGAVASEDAVTVHGTSGYVARLFTAALSMQNNDINISIYNAVRLLHDWF